MYILFPELCQFGCKLCSLIHNAYPAKAGQSSMTLRPAGYEQGFCWSAFGCTLVVFWLTFLSWTLTRLCTTSANLFSYFYRELFVFISYVGNCCFLKRDHSACRESKLTIFILDIYSVWINCHFPNWVTK